MPDQPEIKARADALRAVFEDLHANPELGFEETRRAWVVARLLGEAGVDEVHEGIGLRADMDTAILPVGASIYARIVERLPLKEAA